MARSLSSEHGCFVCPWWGGYFIDNALRRWIFKPDALFSRYVQPGMTVMDIGCGMGINSLSLARLVGPGGRVIAIDLQDRMLAALDRRARRAGLAQRIQTHRCSADSLGLATPVDFAVAFWMVHEVPDARALFRQVCACLSPAASFLVVEPVMHVNEKKFTESLRVAGEAGLKVSDRPRIPLSRAAVLARRSK